MGWGHGEQRGPEGWAAGTGSSCQVRRAAPSSAWRRSRGSRRPHSSRYSSSSFDSDGDRVSQSLSPAQRAHQATAHEPARPRLATGARVALVRGTDFKAEINELVRVLSTGDSVGPAGEPKRWGEVPTWPLSLCVGSATKELKNSSLWDSEGQRSLSQLGSASGVSFYTCVCWPI